MSVDAEYDPMDSIFVEINPEGAYVVSAFVIDQIDGMEFLETMRFYGYEGEGVEFVKTAFLEHLESKNLKISYTDYDWEE